VNGNGTAANGGVSWLSVIDHNLQGWLQYLNRPRDPIVSNATPFGQAPSSSDVQLAVLNAQLQAQQQNQRMLLFAAGAAVVLYLLSR